MIRTVVISITCLLFAASTVSAQTTNQTIYNFLNPVPKNQMRPLTSDVYDGVEDAQTLDAGHFQIETQLINYYFNGSTPYGYSDHGYLWQPRFKVGLLNNVEFTVSPSYEIKDYGPFGTYRSFGNVDLASKVNIWGNNGGTTAFSIQPFLIIPTQGHYTVRGGGDLVLLVRLPEGFSLKFDSEFYATENYALNLYAGFYNSMSINKVVYPDTSVFCYLDSTLNTDPYSKWYGYTGFGVNYNITSDLQLSAGMGFGLKMNSYDYNPRLSCTWRF